MMFEQGFLGTKAALFMDVVTIYFGLLPFLIFVAIRFARQGRIRLHFISQGVLFIVTLAMVVLFEVGVRLSGGYASFSTETSIPLTFLNVFLIVHIIIAVLTTLTWITLLYRTYRSYVAGAMDFVRHKLWGIIVFIGLTVTAVMGCMIYLFLFVY